MVPRCALRRAFRPVIDSARDQWEDGSRRLQAEAGDQRRYAQLLDLVDAVRDELRKRLGQRYTLAELAAQHAEADDWGRDLVIASLPPKPRVGLGDTALVVDAAFRAFARGAVDYAP
jgi:hypothetical protein